MEFTKKTAWLLVIFTIVFITVWVLCTELIGADNEFTYALYALVAGGLFVYVCEWIIRTYYPLKPGDTNDLN